jgi:hypothetical protein
LTDSARRGKSVPAGLPTRGLRRFLLSGRGSIETIARRLSLEYGSCAGFGISIYDAGKELACRVSLRTNVSALAQLLRAIRAQVPSDSGSPYILLSQLGTPRVVSIEEYRTRGICWGGESLAVRRRGAYEVILAHVPCFMGWSGQLLEDALALKCGRGPLLELKIFPTLTEWLGERRAQLTCRGGLRARQEVLGGHTRLRREIRLVTEHLRGQLSDSDGMAYGYDAWRDRVVRSDSVGRKALALAALRRGARVLGDESIVRDSDAALVHLARNRPAVGDIHDAHLLLASNSNEDPVRLARLRKCLRRSGAIVGADAEDQEYFPGVAITALASRYALSDNECDRAVRHYRARFRRKPTWPALWWQLRAWGTVGATFPGITHDFIEELADWALARQLPTGAFDMRAWPFAPFLSICVAEGLLPAARSLCRSGSQPMSRRYIEAARRALRFSRSLVLDERHSNLLPRPERALGGVRSWHGGLILRSDVAGHYLAALSELASLTTGEVTRVAA